MARVDLVMPKMGESIMEATIIRWLKQPGEAIKADETVLEIATDKVDSEVPSPAAGTLAELKFNAGDVVPVGTVIAVIETSVGASVSPSPAVSAPAPAPQPQAAPAPAAVASIPTYQPQLTQAVVAPVSPVGDGGRFYSPLVLNIARQERIGMDELERIPGTGAEGRVTKKDILDYVSARASGGSMVSSMSMSAPVSAPAPAAAPAPISYSPPVVTTQVMEPPRTPALVPPAEVAPAPSGAAPAKKPLSINGEYDIVEMDRMRKLIAANMVASKHTAPHVTSFVEADVTSIVQWREANKEAFEKKYRQKLTFTPIFAEAIARALRDYPMVNIAVDGDRILVRKDINIGMAVALPSGNLIVPTIRNADRLNLPGLAAVVNDLTARARTNKLTPDDIADGTYTFSNVGTFGNVMGTPIILQPQSAVLALGAIKKKPAVLETPQGDVIAVRHLMFLSHSYDHRVIDGMLGGTFVRRVADYLEAFDPAREV